MDFLKAEHVRGTKWRVNALPFGGPLAGRDLDGEFFSPRTDPKPSWFRERPVIFHHGGDVAMKDALVGTQEPIEKEDDGWWADMWLDRQSAYFDRLEAMLQKGKLYGSSGSMPHLVQKATNGEILVWPHVEQTLTFTPINTFARITAAKAVGDFQSAGIELDPTLRDVLRHLEQVTDLKADLEAGGDHLSDSGDAAAMRRLEAIDNLLRGVRSAA